MIKIFMLIVVLKLTILPDIVYAYIGLGPILPALGSVIAFIFVIAIAVLGIIAYPIKKIFDKIKKNKNKKK